MNKKQLLTEARIKYMELQIEYWKAQCEFLTEQLVDAHALADYIRSDEFIKVTK